MNIRIRYNYEVPIEIRNIFNEKIYGLPEVMDLYW